MMRKLRIKRAVATVVAALTVAVIGGLTSATPAAAADYYHGGENYRITVYTGTALDAGTDANVYITLCGTDFCSEEEQLANSWLPGPPAYCCRSNPFERGDKDIFTLSSGPVDYGELQEVRIRHDNSGSNPSWNLAWIHIVPQLHYTESYFPCFRWLATDQDDGSIDRTIVWGSCA